MADRIPLGPVMVDIAGTELTDAERELLRHPLVGGVIFFTRNFESPTQVRRLAMEIRAIRSPALIMAVDHEGGRVQRFRTGFTVLPPMRDLGRLYDTDEGRALGLAYNVGLILACELRGHGFDLAFAPVLDLDFGRSGVIGNRAFHRDPHVVGTLACELMRGMRDGGMAAVGKHFPGHGWVEADSHHAVPRDDRPLDAIVAEDLVPYRMTIPAGLAGVMPAHVVYTQIDSAQPAGFSPFWIQSVLRGRLGFRGLVFSDDLSMEGASVAGGVVERAEAAFEAGCDMVLVCNAPADARKLVDALPPRELDPVRAAMMRPETQLADPEERYLVARRAFGRESLA
jgi:beta-N-acetylhexosaminidase